MVVPLSGDHGCHIVDAGKVFAGINDLQELEIGPHVIQLHREIFRLHLDFEISQIADCLVPADRQKRDFLARFRSPVPASMRAMRFVSENVICRQMVLPPNC